MKIYWYQDETEQRTKIDPHLHGQLVSNRDAEAIQWGKNSLLTNSTGTATRTYLKKKKNFDYTSRTTQKLTRNGSHAKLQLLGKKPKRKCL